MTCKVIAGLKDACARSQPREYRPIYITHYRVERGGGDRLGWWAVVKVERGLASNGEVITVHRTIDSWWCERKDAVRECEHRGRLFSA